jgi:hypothetical protein
VLGQPALVAGHHRGDAQRVALLAEQRVAAVTRAVGPDLSRLGEVHDVFGVVARPRDVGLARRERLAHGVDGGHEVAVVSELVEGGLTHPRHDPHRHGDVGRVGDLDAQGGDLGPDRTHAERHDVHRATAHAALEEARQGLAHLLRILPVVRRTGVDLALGADEGPALDPGDVGGVGCGVKTVRAQCLVEREEGALADHQGGQPRPFLIRAVAPFDAVGLGELGDRIDPLEQLAVVCRTLGALNNVCTRHLPMLGR